MPGTDELLTKLALETAERRYAWTKQMMNLATGALTALIALQKTFVPANPKYLWMLQACWGLLAAGIVLCALHLRGDYQAYRNAGDDLQRAAAGESPGRLLVAYPGRVSNIAFAIFPWVLLTAMLLLSTFAILNIHPAKDEPPPLLQ